MFNLTNIKVLDPATWFLYLFPYLMIKSNLIINLTDKELKHSAYLLFLFKWYLTSKSFKVLKATYNYFYPILDIRGLSLIFNLNI